MDKKHNISREELLNPLNRPKTYVSYLPYLEGNDKRYRADIFTTLDYREDQIIEREDTKGAVLFAEDFIKRSMAISETLKEKMKVPFLDTEVVLSVDLGYFIDSRYRTQKNFKERLEMEDFIFGYHAVTIGGSYVKADGNSYYIRKTFVVNLESFLQEINDKGYNVSLFTSSSELIKMLIEIGVDASPCLKIAAYSKIAEEDAPQKAENGAKSLT